MIKKKVKCACTIGGYMYPLKKPLDVGSTQWFCFISYSISICNLNHPLIYIDNLFDNHLNKVD